MTTADKYAYLVHNSKKLLFTAIDEIEEGEFREVDRKAQEIYDVVYLQYLVTLLCDELVYLTKDEVEG